MQLHLHPIGRAVEEQSSIALYFATEKPTRRLFDVPLGSREIDIPPGAAAYRVTDSFTLPVDVDAVGIIPHAHYIGRRVLGYAILPSGRRRWLLRIDDWDFNQQEHYRYREPVRLPAGSKLSMTWIYDNSAFNPRNPNRPPKRVLWGPDSTDEMAGLHVQVIPVRSEDSAELAQALWGKFMRAMGGSFYRKPPE
jgi:hypothetical protein